MGFSIKIVFVGLKSRSYPRVAFFLFCSWRAASSLACLFFSSKIAAVFSAGMGSSQYIDLKNSLALIVLRCSWAILVCSCMFSRVIWSARMSLDWIETTFYLLIAETAFDTSVTFLASRTKVMKSSMWILMSRPLPEMQLTCVVYERPRSSSPSTFPLPSTTIGLTCFSLVKFLMDYFPAVAWVVLLR